MLKLTDEQRKEVLIILNEMLFNTKQEKTSLSQLTDWWREDFNKLFDETINDIENFIKKIETDKDFVFSNDFWQTALFYEIVKTKDKNILCELNMGFKDDFDDTTLN